MVSILYLLRKAAMYKPRWRTPSNIIVIALIWLIFRLLGWNGCPPVMTNTYSLPLF